MAPSNWRVRSPQKRPRKGWFPKTTSLPASETTVEKASLDVAYWTSEIKRLSAGHAKQDAKKNLAEAKARLRFANYRNIPSGIRTELRVKKQHKINERKENAAWRSAQINRELDAGIGNLALYCPDGVLAPTNSKYLEQVLYKQVPERIKAAAYAACQAARSRLAESTKAKRLAAEVMLRRLGIIRIEWFYPVFNRLISTNNDTGETKTVYSTYIFDALAVHKSGKWYYIGGISPYISPNARQRTDFVPAFIPQYSGKRQQTDIFIAGLHRLRFINLHTVSINQLGTTIESQFEQIERIHQLIKASNVHPPDNQSSSAASSQMSGVENPPLKSILPSKTSLRTQSDRGPQTRQQTLIIEREPNNQLMVDKDSPNLNSSDQSTGISTGHVEMPAGGNPKGEARSLGTQEGMIQELSPSFVSEGPRKTLDLPHTHVGSPRSVHEASVDLPEDEEVPSFTCPPISGGIYRPFSRSSRPSRMGRRYST